MEPPPSDAAAAAAFEGAFAPTSAAEVLQVQVVEARGLIAADRGGTSDPFAQASLLDARGRDTYPLEKLKTDVQKKTLAPYWGADAYWGQQVTRREDAARQLRDTTNEQWKSKIHTSGSTTDRPRQRALTHARAPRPRDDDDDDRARDRRRPT